MFKKVALVILSAFVLGGCTFSLDFLKPAGKSGMQVTSTPPSTVFLDGNSLGTTPIQQESLKPGKHSVKLVPTDSTIQPWETSVTLTPGVLTVIDRQLSAQPAQSGGYTLSFEKINKKDGVELAVTTIPDSVTVSVDNNPQGFTPLSLDTLSAGDHTIAMTSPGFSNKTIRARAVAGYRLTIAAQLIADNSPTPTPTPTMATPSATPTTNLTPTPTKKVTPTPTLTLTPTTSVSTQSATPAKPYVTISGTPTGYLKVRNAPSGTEIGKVYPGEKYSYLDSDPSGWYKIQFQPTQTGWISTQYATLTQ